jgi:hypothetical protein
MNLLVYSSKRRANTARNVFSFLTWRKGRNRQAVKGRSAHKWESKQTSPQTGKLEG